MLKYINLSISQLYRVTLFLFLLFLSHLAFSQEGDSAKAIYHFGGAVTLTTNGISLIPTFTLDKPALMFNMSVGNRKLSFEPQFRFSLEGKPWAFIFWWRYKLIQTEKFRFTLGTHPALAFRPATSIINGVSEDVLIAKRYLAGEVSPNYMLSENISIGTYYLYSHGFDKGATRNVHFLTINSKFSNIKLSNQVYINLHPQFYYLKMDEQDGFYFTSTFALARRNFPLSLNAIINKVIQTDISASKDLIWNVSLIYSFNKEYVRKQRQF